MKPLKTCHGCGFEDGDLCTLKYQHKPSFKRRCRRCIRNPGADEFPKTDLFIEVQKLIETVLIDHF